MAGIRFFSTFAPNYAKIKEMNIDFDKCGGLVPAIVQDANTRKVLMLGYMDKEAFDKTIKTKKVTFWSRSRQCLWTKGETSGNFLNMVDIKIDCDNDTLLVQAIPDGPTCHTGTDTCWGETNDGFDLAFLKELFLEGKGGIDLYFVVQDLVSDEILWELKAPSDDDYEYAPGQGLHERFIADYESQINGKLAEYGITVSPCSYERLPYTAADGRTFSVSIDDHDTGKLMYDMFSVTSYSCIVTDGKGRSKKVIADKEFMGPEAFACGCIKSPYEDRLAIIVAEATFGFEGSDILFCIAGCDMKKGF